jgi:hypothetical protein
MRCLVLCFVLVAPLSAFSQARVIHLPAPINHPSINVSAPYVSLDGRSLLFVSDNAEDNLPTVFFSEKSDGVNWKAPAALPKNISGRMNFLKGFGLSPDGRLLFVTSTRGGGLGGYDIYQSDKKGAYWSEPVNVGQPVNSKENESCPSLTTDGNTMYFMRCTRMDPNVASGCRIMVATRKPGATLWNAPAELPASINTGNSQTPRIMGDSETLIFSSDQMGGKGAMDLFVSKKTGNAWSTPVPLDFVNTPGIDQFVSGTSLGRYLMKDAPSASGTSELIELLFPPDLKPKGVMKVEGRITGPANPASPYVNIIDINSKAKILSSRPSKEGVFTVYLPESSMYALNVDPEQDNFTFHSRKFDLTAGLPGTLEIVDIALKPLVKGDVIELTTSFQPQSTELTEDSRAELLKAARMINGNQAMKFNVEVSLYGYQIDSIQSSADLTEPLIDSVYYTMTKTSTDSTGAVTTESTDSLVVKTSYHNDRTLLQALEVVNFLIEQGVPAGNVAPANRVFDAIPEERKTLVRLIAR